MKINQLEPLVGLEGVSEEEEVNSTNYVDLVSVEIFRIH